MKQRFSAIDDLRGFAMIAMILIHTNAYFWSDTISAVLRDWSQFAVPFFLFCSAYIYFKKNYIIAGNTPAICTYIKKRFLRLLIPYYLFAIIFLCLVYWKEPAKVTWQYIFQSITLTGGIDINWLVLLFLYVTILMPIFDILQRQSKPLFHLYTLFALIASILFIYYRWSYNYRFIMWLPWSIILIYAIYLVRYEEGSIQYKGNRFLLISATVAGILFMILRILETGIHHSLQFYDNKYPPNLYIISYGIGTIALLYNIAKRRAFSFPLLQKVLHFFSNKSYSLYFIHYSILYVLSFMIKQWHFNWVIFFLAVLSFSVFTQIMFDFVNSVVRQHQK